MAALDWPRPIRRLLLLVMVVLIFVGIFFAGRLLILPALSRKTMQQLSLHSGTEIYPFGNQLVYRDGESIKCLDASNTVLWSFPLDNPASQFSVDNGHVAIWYDTHLTVLDESGKPLYSPPALREKILWASCGNSITMLLIGGEEEKYLQAVNKEGSVFETRSLSQKNPMDMRFFSRDDLLWFSYLETNSSVPRSVLQIMQPSKKRDTGQITDTEQILYRAIFNLNLNEIVVVGTRTLTFCDQNLTPSTSSNAVKQVYGYQLLDTRARKDATCFLFARNSAAGEEEALLSEVHFFYGRQEIGIHLPSDCLTVLLGDKAIYAVAPDRIYTYDYPTASKGLGQPRVTQMEIAVDRVIALLEGDNLVLSSGDSVFLLPM